MATVSQNVKPRRFPAHCFSLGRSADANRVFLLKNHDEQPYLRPVEGWQIIGFGKAPWPGLTDGFAALFEKVTPAEEQDNIFAPEYKRFDEGTRIWQHMTENHFKQFVHFAPALRQKPKKVTRAR